ncbi:MAG: InlB B-repeat-containing protein, partial [Clostridia bacterium]|nr:InlB B-repeat-containing protein [Clostridia bacterium]
TNNKHNNAKTLLTWDAVEMPGVYVTYLVKVGHRYTEEYEEGQYRDTVYSWVEATTSSTSFDFYEIIQPYLNCSDTANGEYCCIVYARSNNTNICANSSQSDFSNTFNVAFFGGSDYIINGVWVDEETKYLIEGEICELKAGYLPENYEFVSWYCESDGEFEFGNINSATTTFKMSETNFDTFYEISYSAKLKTNDITAISNNGAFGSVTAFTEAPISNTFTVAGNVISIKNSSNKVVKTITATPKESDPQYCYKFVGWTGLPLDNKFTEDTTIVANFVRIINTYTIKFEVETDSNEFGSVDTASVTANYGELVTFKGNIITVGSDTIKAEALADTAKYTYDFDSWLNKIEVLEGNVTIKAVFNRVHNSYKVTFDANTGTITSGDSEKTLLYEDEYGTLPTASKPGYEFNGWKTKNLIPYPFVASYNDKFVSHEDQSITINVDAQEGWPAFRFVENKTIKAGKYVFSVFDKNGGAIGLENISFVIAYSDNSGKTQYLGAKSGEIVNVQNDLDYKVMYIQVSPNLTVKGTFFFQLEAGDTATEYSPYVNYSGDKLSETDKLLTWGDHILIADWV